MRASLLLWLILVTLFHAGAIAAESNGAADDNSEYAAPVALDGQTLFRVRGVSAMPARDRARQILERIVSLARNPAVDPADIRPVTEGDSIGLQYESQRILKLYPADAELEAVPLEILAEVVQQRLVVAIEQFRELRTPERLLRNTAVLFAISLVGALLLWGIIVLARWLDRVVEKQVKRHIEQLEQVSHRMIDSRQMWSLLRGLLRTARGLVIALLVLVWLETALGLYPWTRPLAENLFNMVLDPLRELATGLVESLPDLFFLVILAIVVRFILRVTSTFFNRLHRGWIRLESLDRELALPTYRIIRVMIIVFALVVAYPYIPGSGSDAFKGMSIFFGVILSIGSSSFIANIIAGYSLTYRRAFRQGDRVRIGDFEGNVLELRTLNTRLRSPKNEEVNIPNSIVLGSAIVNYTAFEREQGLILHTEVGIGYDTSWRQVEAMLKEAATRTAGLKQEPPPFVLQKSLGDFTVQYQLNAYCDDANRMNRLYSALHANIQDVFNEHGVQIMSPHYVADTSEPKVVPPDKW